MNVRKQKLARRIALQTAVSAPKDNHDITELRVWSLREPASGRTYTVLRLRTKSGLTGWGESGRVNTADVEAARARLIGRPATAYAVTRTETALDPALNSAMLDITAKACSAPVYRLLGGPTRFKARALAALHGETDTELASSLAAGIKVGYRAFEAPLPATAWRNQGQAFDKAVRARMEALRSHAPENVNFVLRSDGTLTAGDAASVAASLERFHLLWFDEPCASHEPADHQKDSRRKCYAARLRARHHRAFPVSGLAPRRPRGHSAPRPSYAMHQPHSSDRGDG